MKEAQIEKFTATDKLKNPIIVECERLDPRSTQFSEKLKGLSDILAQAYVPVEVQFSRKFPDAVPHDKFLKPLESHFRQGIQNVDWKVVLEQTKAILKQFFAEDFVKGACANKDFCANFDHVFAVAKENKTGKPLGAIYFLISPDNSHSFARIPIFGIMPAAQNRGIGKLLMSSVLKFVPSAKKIALSTRVTNESALKAYHSWGFTPCPSTMENWANMEYAVEGSDRLQKTAKTLNTI